MLTITPSDYIFVTANDQFGHSTEFAGNGFATVADIVAHLPVAVGMTTLTIRNASRGCTHRLPVYRATAI